MMSYALLMEMIHAVIHMLSGRWARESNRLVMQEATDGAYKADVS